MPTFYCKAVHSDGGLIDEVREAPSMETIVSDLQEQGYVPIRVVPANTMAVRLFSSDKQHLKNKQVLLFTQQLATLLQAGLPLDQALNMLLELTESVPELNCIVEQVFKQIKQGVALSNALQQQGCGFSRFYIGIIKAGEASGDIAGSLLHLSEYLERIDSLRSTVVSALVYPAILLFTSVASIVLLMTLVLPQFAELFADSGKELPLPTAVVMGISTFLQSYWWALLVVMMACVAVARHIMSVPELRYRWDRRCLAFPLVGDLIKKVEVTRFSYTLASLLGNGLPLLEALSIVKNTLTNRVMVELIEQARENLKQGKTVSSALDSDDQFPKMAVRMIRLGEETGSLKTVLDKLSSSYDQEVKVSLQRLLSLFEPILILVLGIVISGIIFSVLLALVSINDFAF